MLRVVRALLLFLPFAAGAQFDVPERTELARDVVTVPLVKNGDFYDVDVQVNGRPFRFTVETGANFFGITARAAQALGLRVDSAEAMPGMRAAVARVETLTLGGATGATFRGLSARVLPRFASDVDGIVSLPVLRNLLATLDLGGNTLRLERGALPAPNGRDVLPFAGADRGERVDFAIDVGGVAAPAVVDTRSSFWLITPDSLGGALRLDAPARFVTQAMGPTLGTFTLRGARLTAPLRVGPVAFERGVVMLRDRPGTVLGVPLLEHLVLTIDQVNRRVRVAPRGDERVVRVPPQGWETSPARGAPSAAPNMPPSGTWTMGFGMAGAPGAAELRVVTVFPGSSAEKVGLKVDDRVVEFDGTPAESLGPAVTRAAAARGRPVKVVVLRDGGRVELTVSPYQIP